MWKERISNFLADFQFNKCDEDGAAFIRVLTSKGIISLSKRRREFRNWNAETWSRAIQQMLQENHVETEEINFATCDILFFDYSGDYGTYMIELYVVYDIAVAQITRNFDEEATLTVEKSQKINDTLSAIRLAKEVGFKKGSWRELTPTETPITPIPTATPTPKP